MSTSAMPDIGPDKSLLLVDDDEPFLRRLAKAMEKRGFEIETAESVAAGRAIATARPPAYAVVDLRLEDGNGLDVVEVLREKRPDCRVVVLTGYGAIATAVAAVALASPPPILRPLLVQVVRVCARVLRRLLRVRTLAHMLIVVVATATAAAPTPTIAMVAVAARHTTHLGPPPPHRIRPLHPTCSWKPSIAREMFPYPIPCQ